MTAFIIMTARTVCIVRWVENGPDWSKAQKNYFVLCSNPPAVPGQKLPRMPYAGVCHSGKGNRIVEVNHSLRAYKEQAKEKLNSPQGVTYRKKRPVDVEPVFAQIKSNHGFRRFRLKGLNKVEIE